MLIACLDKHLTVKWNSQDITIINMYYCIDKNIPIIPSLEFIMHGFENSIAKWLYRMAGAFYIVTNNGDISINTLSLLSAVCYFHVTAIVWSGKFDLFEFST